MVAYWNNLYDESVLYVVSYIVFIYWELSVLKMIETLPHVAYMCVWMRSFYELNGNAVTVAFKKERKIEAWTEKTKQWVISCYLMVV